MCERERGVRERGEKLKERKREIGHNAAMGQERPFPVVLVPSIKLIGFF